MNLILFTSIYSDPGSLPLNVISELPFNLELHMEMCTGNDTTPAGCSG